MCFSAFLKKTNATGIYWSIVPGINLNDLPFSRAACRAAKLQGIFPD